MSSESIQAFNDKVADSPALQEQLRSITSPIDLIALAKEQGCELTGSDLQQIAQQAYQQWIDRLSDSARRFFEQARTTPFIDQQLKQCRTPIEVLAQAKAEGLELTEADLQQTAAAAEAIEGFSFEKLWFRGLGLTR